MTIPPLPDRGEVGFKELQARGWTLRMIGGHLAYHCLNIESCEDEGQREYLADVVRELEELVENTDRMAQVHLSRMGVESAEACLGVRSLPHAAATLQRGTLFA